MIYPVTITETLRRTIHVEADSPEAAECQAEAEYCRQDHILGAEDFDGVSFDAGQPKM